MEDYVIILDPEKSSSIQIKCRAPSVVAVLKRAAGLLPANVSFEIRSHDRCLYKGRFADQAVVSL